MKSRRDVILEVEAPPGWRACDPANLNRPGWISGLTARACWASADGASSIRAAVVLDLAPADVIDMVSSAEGASSGLVVQPVEHALGSGLRVDTLHGQVLYLWRAHDTVVVETYAEDFALDDLDWMENAFDSVDVVDL